MKAHELERVLKCAFVTFLACIAGSKHGQQRWEEYETAQQQRQCSARSTGDPISTRHAERVPRVRYHRYTTKISELHDLSEHAWSRVLIHGLRGMGFLRMRLLRCLQKMARHSVAGATLDTRHFCGSNNWWARGVATRTRQRFTMALLFSINFGINVFCQRQSPHPNTPTCLIYATSFEAKMTDQLK